MTRHAIVASPLGDILLRTNGNALSGVFFMGQRHFPDDAPAVEVSSLRSLADDATLGEAARQLDAYFAGHWWTFTLALEPHGSDFQKRVWRALQTIGYGQRTSYGALARQLGLAPGAARAVGAAVGRNPLSIMVPCHRVVGSDGSLTGYAGGLERKRALLGLEADSLAAASMTTARDPG